jgi:hypothetical protein
MANAASAERDPESLSRTKRPNANNAPSFELKDFSGVFHMRS